MRGDAPRQGGSRAWEVACAPASIAECDFIKPVDVVVWHQVGMEISGLGVTLEDTMSDRQAEVERNFARFQELLPTLDASTGKFALMRHGEIIQIYDTFADALKTAAAFYKDDLYSIQRITDKPIDLGLRSRALLRR